MKATESRFQVSKHSGTVSALFLCPKNAEWLLVLGHGAGAGMKHPFMQATSEKLAEAGIATFRYNFPYMEQKSRRPDPRPILLATVAAAVKAAHDTEGSLPLLAGGKSMGGRMTSNAAAEQELAGVRGIVFLGFPLHPPGQPSDERAEHLQKVQIPMLFLQGTRDKLADLTLLRPVVKRLGARATLHVTEGADHSFHMPKSSGRSDDEVLDELVGKIKTWGSTLR